MGALAFAVASALVADARGRNPFIWFAVGFLLPCIGLVIVLALPDVKQEEAHRQALELENRRLQERVTKERHVSDKRFAETQRRLKVHDRELAVDTGPTATDPDLIAEGVDTPPPPPPAIWYYAEGQEHRGPVAMPVLRRLWEERTIGPHTLVWKQGMSDWTELRDVTEIGEELA